MRLLIALITYNRLAYTQKTLESLKKTLSVPHMIVAVDNNSTDGTQDWLNEMLGEDKIDWVINRTDNGYPGKACNEGWAFGVNPQSYVHIDATHLMRCDNDMEFEPGWDQKAEEYFETMPMLGQLGLDHSALDTFNGDERYLTTVGDKTINAWPGNIGGPCIIRREVYDRGARYDETPWKDERNSSTDMITPQEDVKFSLMMHTYGYIYGHPTQKLATTFADESNRSDYPSYYKQTFRERGYTL